MRTKGAAPPARDRGTAARSSPTGNAANDAAAAAAAQAMPKRGRPRKIRPVAGDLGACRSDRDIEAAFGISRRSLAQARLVASIPDDEFERIVESDEPGNRVKKLVLLARRRAGKCTEYVRRCPYCGKALRLEDA